MGSQKKVRQKESAENRKLPKNIENPEGYLKKHPVWAFQYCDLSHDKWSITKCNSFYDDIMKKLISFEGMIWDEIQKASGGKGAGNGTNSHFERISDLCKDAQKRAMELHLDVDELFSLRLTGKLRVYGILENGIFSVVWYDPEHEIYPSKNK